MWKSLKWETTDWKPDFLVPGQWKWLWPQGVFWRVSLRHSCSHFLSWSHYRTSEQMGFQSHLQKSGWPGGCPVLLGGGTMFLCSSGAVVLSSWTNSNIIGWEMGYLGAKPDCLHSAILCAFPVLSKLQFPLLWNGMNTHSCPFPKICLLTAQETCKNVFYSINNQEILETS